MKSPDQIDDLIHRDIQMHRAALNRLAREKAFAEAKVEELTDKLACDHEQDGKRNKCRKCGFVWCG